MISGPAAQHLDADAYMALWREWAQRWNTELSNDKRGEIFRSVFTVDRLAKFEAALRGRGFRVQRIGNVEDLWTAGAAGALPV